MFLVLIFSEIVKNGPCIIKTIKRNIINFPVIKNGPFRLFFSTANKMIISGSHYLNFIVHTFCEKGKNDPYILK
jgi:hypothetical protein